MRDKWGLPRKWRCWRDPLFWFCTTWILVSCFPLLLMIHHRLVYSLFSPEGLVVVALVFGMYASIYWVIYDTYRWEHPDRWLWFFIVLVLWALGLPLYLIRRQEWFQELAARRNRPI